MLWDRKLPYALVFVAAFVFLPLLSTFGLGGLFVPSDITYICVIISLFSFLFFYSVGKQSSTSSIPLEREENVSYNRIIIANLFAMAAIIYMLPTIMAFYAVHTMADARYDDATLEFFGNAKMATLYGLIVSPSIVVSFLCILDDLLHGSKVHFVALFLTILNMALNSVIFGGRSLLVQCGFYCLFYFLFFRKNIELPKRKKKKVLKIVGISLIAIIAVFVFITNARRSEDDADTSFYTYFLMYYVGPFVLFDHYANTGLLSLPGDMYWGTCLFGPIYNFIMMGVSVLVPSIDYQGSDYLISQVTQNNRIDIGYDLGINAAVTAMYPFIKDFWLFGLVVGFGFWGFVTGKLEKLRNHDSKRLRIITLLFLYVVFKLQMRYELGSTLLIMLVLVFLFIKKRKGKYVK